METNELYRGRLIDHVQLVVADLERSRRFYTTVLEVFGIPIAGEGPGFFWADEFVVSSADSPAASGVVTGRTHLAFQARDRETVERFHRAALAAGGTDNGAPGLRPAYHPAYFAAFVIDPDGNNVEAVHHGPARFSAPFVKITF